MYVANIVLPSRGEVVSGAGNAGGSDGIDERPAKRQSEDSVQIMGQTLF